MNQRSLMSEEVRHRLNGFQQLLRENRVDGALLVQRVDVYYLSGSDQEAHLWVPADGEPLLMVRKSVERAMADAVIDRVRALSSFSKLPEHLAETGTASPVTMGLEMDILPVKMYQTYKRLFPGTKMVDISSLIREVRMIKSAHEVGCIQKAAEMADLLYERLPDFIRESESETDLAIKAEAFYRNQGHPGIIRFRAFNMEIHYGHILAGPNSAVPSSSPGPTGGSGVGPFASQGPGMNPLGEHQPIIVDYASFHSGYIADHARIFSKGPLPDKFHQAHQTMLTVQESIAAEGRPGTKAKDLYALALDIVKKAGFRDGFMGHPQPVPFVGHGIGLEMDEWPVIGKHSAHILKEGMVLALEPKYIFPREGAVGIENSFVVCRNGMEKLNRYPDDIVIC